MAMTEVAKATVTIIPNMKGSQEKISKDLGAIGDKSGNDAGNNFVKTLLGKVKQAGIGIAIGKFIGDSLAAGADLQQSFGGLDTLYGDAANAAKDYAKEAWKAGISANDYAEQAVSFGASLKKAFGGDTAKAAEAANTAIMDMTDNAAKMGTPLESIQNAYQGFAKGQYNMLDNLKLGYGGTKQEMERLLADASKLSGVEYNIDNLGDVYEAIHVIQEDLGLTGVAAQEASETFSGSMGAMKAAASNLLADLALGNDISADLDSLGSSIKTFVVGNLLPMIGNLVAQIPSIIAAIPGFVADILPDLLDGVADMVVQLAQAIVENGPKFIAGIGDLLATISEAFAGIDWAGVASTMLDGLSSAIGGIWDSVTGLLQAEFGIEMPDWDTVVQDISTLWENVKAGIADFFKAAFDIITDDDKTITEKISGLWDLVKSGIADFFKGYFDIVLPAYETIVSAISDWWGTNIWPSIQNFFKTTFGIDLPDWSTIVEPIKELWEKVKAGIADFFAAPFDVKIPSAEEIITAIDGLWTTVWNGITGFFNAKFGLEIPTWEDVKEKITNFWNDVKEGISGFFKKTFNVTMPSWDSVQEKIKEGWEAVKKGVGSIFKWLFSLDFPSIDDVVQDIKDFWDSVVKGVGDFVTLKWLFGEPDEEEAKTKFTGSGRKFEVKSEDVSVDSKAIQDALNSANLKLADIDTASLDTALASVTTCISGMEQAFKDANLDLPSVKTSPLTVAKTAVVRAVASIKGTMNFSWSLPTLHGHLPVISVNMREAKSSDGRTSVSYPDLFVSGLKWFAQGGIFNSPQIIGIGERGPEAVVPLDQMWKQMRAEISDSHANGAVVNNYFTVDGAQDPEAWAMGAARAIKRELRMA